MPGAHNVDNAAAAALVALALGVSAAAIERALPRFPGLARRFEVVGDTTRGIRVVDDYAHNVEKLRAAVAAAQHGCERLLAVFQPHGFGPARFMRADLADLWPRVLRPPDRLCYAEIYYAGGTTARDISSAALAGDLPAALDCAAARDHDAVVAWAAREARPGDTVLVMGARDPRLPPRARRAGISRLFRRIARVADARFLDAPFSEVRLTHGITGTTIVDEYGRGVVKRRNCFFS
jgi:UDP-N-acetylmuramate--alanine ligase